MIFILYCLRGLLVLLYHSLVFSTQMNGAFRVLWLAGSEVIHQYNSHPRSRRDKIARQQFNFRLLSGDIDRKKLSFFGFSVVYTETVIHLHFGK